MPIFKIGGKVFTEEVIHMDTVWSLSMARYGYRTLCYILIAETMVSLYAMKPLVKLINHMERVVPYSEAYSYQQKLLLHQISLQEELPSDAKPPQAGYLYILQHSPVYTLGTSLSGEGLPLRQVPSSSSSEPPLPFDVHRSDRAGEATFHGPGQIVFYPILDLHYFNRDINLYLRGLEEVIIQSVATFGIEAGRVPGLTVA